MISKIVCSKHNPFNCLDCLLQVKSEDRSYGQIIFWWELRRWLYNFICGLVGFLCLYVLELIVPHRGSEDAVEPIALAAFIYLCQICYTLGWFTECMFLAMATGFNDCRWLKPGKIYAPRCFKLGLGLTLCVILLPVCLWSTN
jgi:hypothetical protein